MNTPMIVASTLGAVAITAGGVGVVANITNDDIDYAKVVAVEEVTQTERIPRQECRDEVVTTQAPAKDPNRVAGTAIGAVVGGLIGNQVGGGSGKKLATAAGAVAGGYAGNQVQGNMQANNTTQTVQQRCDTVYDERENVVGYEVSYTIDGKPGMVRMDEDPGDRIPVKDGELVLSAEANAESDSDQG